jgi:hypothetical protein
LCEKDRFDATNKLKQIIESISAKTIKNRANRS